jgi:hypothetical protein
VEYTPDTVPSHLRDRASTLLQKLNARRATTPFQKPMPQDARLIIGRSGEEGTRYLSVGFTNQTQSNGGTAGLPIAGAYSSEVYPEFFRPDRPDKEYADARRPLQLSKQMEGRKLDDLLEQFADEMKINIVAESYYEGRRPAPLAIPQRETTIEAVLDDVVPQRHSYWWKRGPVYMVQRRFWWSSRAREVPESVLSRLRQIFKQSDQTLDDWGEVGRLIGPEQTGRVESEEIAPLQGLIEAQLPLLAFYGYLQPMQRARVFSHAGLPWGNLRKEDQKRLAAWITASPAMKQSQETIPWDAVRVFAYVKQPTPPMARTFFRAVIVRDDVPEQVLRQSGVPGEPPKRMRARTVKEP